MTLQKWGHNPKYRGHGPIVKWSERGVQKSRYHLVAPSHPLSLFRFLVFSGWFSIQPTKCCPLLAGDLKTDSSDHVEA